MYFVEFVNVPYTVIAVAIGTASTLQITIALASASMNKTWQSH